MTFRTTLAIASLFLLVTACGGTSDGDGTGGSGGSGGAGGSHAEPPRCGDGLVNQADEECDRNAIPSSCSDHGFPHGAIGCTESCTFDISGCRDGNDNPPRFEDCETPGDEEGNGLADCDDPACIGRFECPVCGDGILQSGEDCDGTTMSSCTDLGFELGATLCSNECLLDTSACRDSVCGDGVREVAEYCDDGNLVDRDGCSSACVIEGDDCSSAIQLDAAWDASVGYWRATIDMAGFGPDVTPRCFDAQDTADAVVSFTAPSAGAWEIKVESSPGGRAGTWAWSGTCEVPEPDLSCDTSGDSQSSLTLDMAADETIHFAIAGVEADRALTDVTVRAAPIICGDGIQVGAEECDDGNLIDGDGCTAACLIPGEDCLNPYDFSETQPFFYLGTDGRRFENDYTGSCGDGSGPEAVGAYTAPAAGYYEIMYYGSAPNRTLYVWDTACGSAADEMLCADSADGWGAIYAKTALYAGQTIYFAADHAAGEAGEMLLTISRVKCGDGNRQGSEECDDRNAVGGDGCSATCTIEATLEVEPNDTLAAATPLLDAGRGTLASQDDIDHWSFDLVAGTEYSIYTGVTRQEFCGLQLDTTLALYDAAGTLLVEDARDAGCSVLTFTPPTTGTYKAAVGASAGTGRHDEYILYVAAR